MSIFPWRLLSLSKVFQHDMWTYLWPTHAKKLSFLWNDKQVYRSCKASTKNHRNQWEGANNVIRIITKVNLFLYPRLGAIITFLSKITSNKKFYNVTLCNFPSCTCIQYESMNGTCIYWKTWHVCKLQIPILHLPLIIQIRLQEIHVHPCLYPQLRWSSAIVC